MSAAFSPNGKNVVTGSIDKIINIWDFNGNNIICLVNKFQSANSYSISWDGKNNFGQNVSSGVYLYVIKYGNLVEKKKMILLK